MRRTLQLLAIGSALALCGFAQNWDQSYQTGLKAGHAGHWMEARQAFLAAEKDRAGDSPKASTLPGSPTDPQRWRDGAPYSPNFLAAYCAYRAGLNSNDLAQQTQLFNTAAGEFSHLLTNGECSRDAFFFLDVIYSRLGDQTKRQALADLAKKQAKHLTWKVDEEIVAPEEVAAISVAGIGTNQMEAGPGHVPSINPSQISAPPVEAGAALPTPATGVVTGKYALVVGESGTKLGPSQLPYAATDVATVKDSLVNYAGYPANNVVTCVDAPAAGIMEAAKKLATQVPQDGVVLIYFVGPGANLHGKDYLAGADAESLDDPTTMVGKIDLFNLFFAQGARIFAFFEVNRPILNSTFFGSEALRSGAASQMEATIPDSTLTSLMYKGNQVGLFALSFANVLADLRSSRVPIREFGWLVYKAMRTGNSGTDGGSSPQTPTLPMFNMLASDARF